MSRHGSQTTGKNGSTKEARQYCILAIISGMESTRREQESELERGLVTSTINALACDDKLEAVTFERVKEATKNDTELTILAEAIENTASDEKLPKAVEHYEKYRQDLHILDGVVMYGRRVSQHTCASMY